MKAAFSYEGKKIAPVFDVARKILVIEEKHGLIVGRTEKSLDDDLQIQNVIRLSGMGVETLVCGAVSMVFHKMLSAYGIFVVPFVTGNLEEIIEAWLKGRIGCGSFSMPGYEGRHKGKGYGHQRGKKTTPGGMVPRDAEVSRRQKTAGMCICLVCGGKTRHEKGIPCIKTRCPDCGAVMTRG